MPQREASNSGKNMKSGRALNNGHDFNYKKKDKDFDFYTSPIGSDFNPLFEDWDHVTYCLNSYDYPSRVLGYPLQDCGII